MMEDQLFKKPHNRLSTQPQLTEHVHSSSRGHGGCSEIIKPGDNSAIAEGIASDVKIQDRNGGKKTHLISSDKMSDGTLYSSNGRNSGRKMLMLQGNSCSDKGKATCTEVPSRCFTSKDDTHVLDLTVLSEYTGISERACSRGASKDLAVEFRKGSISAGHSSLSTSSRASSNACEGKAIIPEKACSRGASKDLLAKETRKGVIGGSSHSTANSSKASINACEGKTSTDYGIHNGAGVGIDHRKGVNSSRDSKQKTEQIMSKSLQSTTMPRNTGQRRLVRNGCISPYNIARAKHSAESHGKSCEDGKQEGIGKMISSGGIPSSEIHIVSPNSEGNQSGRMDKMKGKRVMEELAPEDESDARAVHLSSRSSLNPIEEANGIGDANGDVFRCFKEGGWRSTHSRSKIKSSALSDEVGRLSRRNNGTGNLLDQNHENRMRNRDCISGVNTSPETDFLEVRDPISFQHGPLRLVQASSIVMSELDRENGQHRGANQPTKRQKKHPSGEPSNARSTRSRDPYRCGPCGTSGPIIEIDELSSEIRCRRPPQDTSRMVHVDPDARARQLEADETFARQLQEQFYNELPVVGGGEIDASIAWTLQQEDAQHASSLGSQHVSHPRDSSRSLRRHPSRFFQSSSVRLANRARAPTSARMARLRNSFRSHSPRLSSRERSLQFPPNMDLDTRIHLLEALEAAAGNHNSMTVAGHFFQVQRDFNENDYEMLLALDEDNHQHVGPSLHQINGLPESTVQNDNFEEACAICLETPTTGDTIRHLPCLHKFHKDCIDPWLRRSTSCPVCKSCIT